MKCYACQAELKPDSMNGEESTYQFDNALWIGFHGGYGMFVDNLSAKLPMNTEDRWLRDEDGEYIVIPPSEGHPYGQPVDNEAWEPEYHEDRMLPGQPDYEAVICHECAHTLCAQIFWIRNLLNPHGSHAHKTAWKEAHPDHWGWDYDPRPVQ